MVNELSDFPPGVIGFEVTGKVQAEDFRDVVLPIFQSAAKRGKFRPFVVVPEFEGCPAARCGRT
jgi:hypothetical protein